MLTVESGQKTIQVISQSKTATDRGCVNPGVRVIESSVEGACNQGLVSVSAESALADQAERDGSGKYCPVMIVKKEETNIVMPGTPGTPLKFNVYCPDPPSDLQRISSWKYLFENLLLNDQPDHKTYVIEAKNCDHGAPFSMVVEVYPKTSISLELSVSYNYQQQKEEINHQESPGKTGKPLVKNQQGSEKTVHLDNWEFVVDLKGNVDHVDLAAQLKYLDPSELLAGMRKSVSLFLMLFDIIYGTTEEKIGYNIAETAFGGKKIIGGDPKPAGPEGGKGKSRSCSGPTGKISIRYPKLVLSGKRENIEVVNSTKLDHSWEFALKADPLIGVQMEVDILAALIKIGANCLLPGSPAMYEAGKKFKEYMLPIIGKLMDSAANAKQKELEGKIEDRNFYLKGGISIKMTVGAQLGCAGQWKKDYGEAEGNVLPAPQEEQESAGSAGASAAMDIYLEGKAFAEGKVFSLKYEAGIIVAVGSAKYFGPAKIEFKLDALLKGGKPAVKGGVEWTGLALLFASYYTVGMKSDDNGSDENSKKGQFDVGLDPEPESSTDASSKEKLYENQWIIIKPGKYPKDKEVPLSEYTKI